MSIERAAGDHLLPARRALADDVYDAVLGLLMDQVIEPGARASIDGIARQLGVSPTPVREALARLESEGMVVKKALKGYTAAPLLDAEGLRELFEMRRLLEPHASRSAAGRMDAETLAELEALCEQMHASGAAAQAGDDRFEDYKDFAKQDADFHRIIAEQAGNALLADAVFRLRSHLHQYRLYFEHGVAEETSEEHDAVLAALRTGDGRGAERAMRDHIDRSYERIAKSLAGER
ncbi:GntR family transcriptional regulator [Leifsonia sp. NPDC080035]|uniref:GntR family transcriptional regulator n=1 Tax=Leifsonia sp. NPDC080035 TaxID=3143936 RepID=A0AAU7GF62_9MICO